MDNIKMYLLLTDEMKPVPSTIKCHVFCSERIVNTETGDLLATGESAYVEGTEEEVIKWLKPLKGFWKTKSPQVGPWELVHIKE